MNIAKRDGRVEAFDEQKIVSAICRAFADVHHADDEQRTQALQPALQLL